MTERENPTPEAVVKSIEMQQQLIDHFEATGSLVPQWVLDMDKGPSMVETSQEDPNQS